MALDRALLERVELAIDVGGSREFLASHDRHAHPALSSRVPRWARIRRRALWTCDLDVPSDTPRIVRHFLVAESLDVVQEERCPARGWQRLDGTFEIDPAHRAQRRSGGRHRRGVRLVHRVGDLPHPGLPVPQHVEAVVHRQPIQPRAQRRLASITAHLSIGQQEDVLQQVLGVACAACHTTGQIVEAGGVLAGTAPRRRPPHRT